MDWNNTIYKRNNNNKIKKLQAQIFRKIIKFYTLSSLPISNCLIFIKLKDNIMSFLLLVGSYGILGILALSLLLIIGIIFIIFIAKVLFFILPAGIIALVVWWLTSGNELLAGIAFLFVAIISLF